MRLIGDGVVDREGVPGLAHRLGYTSRHLGRMLAAEVGATPLALARARRAHTARVLLTTTSLSVGDIAFAAGFSSIRQFNDTIRDVYATDPTSLRSHGRPVSAAPGTLTLRLAVRPPFAGDELLAFLGARAVSGVEYVRGRTYARTLSLPAGKGTVHLAFPAPGGAPLVAATLRLEHLSDLVPAVDRCRRLLDADADPTGVDAQLTVDPFLAATVRQCPGLRLPGAVDGPEILLRAIFGQQVSVASARSTLSSLTATVGRPLGFEPDEAGFDPLLSRLFPSPADIAALDPNEIPGPIRRAGSILVAFQAIASGALVVDAGRRSNELADDLIALPGIGPWTAQYVCMRVLGDPDVLMTGDLALRQGAATLGLPTDPAALTEHAHRWSPFRSYAGLHLWRASKTPVNKPRLADTTARPNPKGSA
jgi:AraC family transcriptional regulator of adaptative response / DNA-3-methyladenine glycosylase II